MCDDRDARLLLGLPFVAAQLGGRHARGFGGTWAKVTKAPVLTGEAKRRVDAAIAHHVASRVPKHILAAHERRDKDDLRASIREMERIMAKYPGPSIDEALSALSSADPLGLAHVGAPEPYTKL